MLSDNLFSSLSTAEFSYAKARFNPAYGMLTESKILVRQITFSLDIKNFPQQQTTLDEAISRAERARSATKIMIDWLVKTGR
jgi:hypothetical protein